VFTQFLCAAVYVPITQLLFTAIFSDVCKFTITRRTLSRPLCYWRPFIFTMIWVFFWMINPPGISTSLGGGALHSYAKSISKGHMVHVTLNSYTKATRCSRNSYYVHSYYGHSYYVKNVEYTFCGRCEFFFSELRNLPGMNTHILFFSPEAIPEQKRYNALTRYMWYKLLLVGQVMTYCVIPASD